MRKICIQTFFGHIIFIKLLCECLATYESQLPTNPIPIVEADVLKIFDIRYFWEAYFDYFFYTLHKIFVRKKIWKIYFSASVLFKWYQKTSGCSSDICIFLASLKSQHKYGSISHKYSISYENVKYKKRHKDAIFSCQKTFSAATLWNFSKVG